MNFLMKSVARVKQKKQFKHLLSFLGKNFFYYDYCSLIWAVRTFVTSLVCLCASYFWPAEALWLLASGAISVQFYAYSEKGATRLMIFSLSLVLSIVSAAAAFFSHWPLVEVCVITISIFGAFYIAYRGTRVAVFSLWAMVFIVIAVCLPSEKQQVWSQLGSFIFATVIAYLATFIRLPRRKKDQPIEQVKYSFRQVQRYMTDVFNRVLTDEAYEHSLVSYENARFALSKIRSLADPGVRLKFVTKPPAFSESIAEFSYLFAKIFHLLVSVDRLELSVLSAEMKLKFEYLNVAFQSLTYLLYQAVNEPYDNVNNNQKIRWNKTSEIIQFTLCEIRKLLETKNLAVNHCLKIASFYYLLEKLNLEFQEISGLLAQEDFNKELRRWKQ